jgi:hypothetical protein
MLTSMCAAASIATALEWTSAKPHVYVGPQVVVAGCNTGSKRENMGLPQQAGSLMLALFWSRQPHRLLLLPADMSEANGKQGTVCRTASCTSRHKQLASTELAVHQATQIALTRAVHVEAHVHAPPTGKHVEL